MKKRILSLLLAAAMLLSLVPAAALAAETEDGSVTVGNGTDKDSHFPTYSFNNYSKSQTIVPASELTALNGKSIIGMSYYPTNQSKMRKVAIYLMETNQNDLNTSFVNASGATAVYSGDVLFTADTETHIDFSTPYVYSGGNLLVTALDLTGTWSSGLQFYGVKDNSDADCFSRYVCNDGVQYDLEGSATGTASMFRPKMAFHIGYTVTNGTPESDKETNHGYITIDKTFAAEDDTVTLTVAPSAGYQLKAGSLKVNDGAVTITCKGIGKYEFTMPKEDVAVTAEFEAVGGTGKTLPYSFDFESDFIAAGWTNFDADGDGQDWITGTNKYGAEGFGVEGGRCAISQSFENVETQSFNADNWLFSPAITIPAGGAIVSWYEQSQDASYPDFYEVYVSETNTSTDTSKMTEIFSGTAANPWTQRSVELEAAEYAGKTVYIAFRHLTYDQYFLEIDDFAVEAAAPAHTHAFTYTANDNKIAATCTAGCDKGYDTTPLTLTLTAPTSLVYDGNVKAFTFADGEADAWETAGLELPTIYYHIKQSGQTEYMPLLGTLENAGNYMAQITVGGKAAQVYFAIDKATPYIKTTPAPNDIEYGKKLADSTLFGGYVQISSTNTTQVGGLFEWKLGDTIPALSDSETTEYDVTFTPADTNNYNTVSCKVKIKVTHTHNPVKVNGQAATETAAGWSDYYECKDSTGTCHKYFEDATAKVEITDLNAWKAQGGKGYIAPLVHSITPVNGKNATDTEAGYKPYYECKNCGKYYEDATGLIEIPDINAWKSQTGKGYIPSGNEINATRTAAKAALDSENVKDALLDETALTNGKSAIDSAETLADIENAKNAAITAIQEAQATELAGAKTSAKSALDTEEAKDPLTDKTALTNGKNSIDGATTKAAVEAAKNAAITAIQEAQATEHKDPKSPQTGDTSNMTLWIMLMALSSVGLCACLVLGKKRKKEQ